MDSNVCDSNSATHANEGSKPIEDYCNINAFAERETEKTTSIAKVINATPTEMGVTKPTSGTMSVEQYSKRISEKQTKRSYTRNETCL